MATDKRLDQVSQLTDFDYALIVKGDQVAKASKQQLAELVGNLLYGATNASSLASVVAGIIGLTGFKIYHREFTSKLYSISINANSVGTVVGVYVYNDANGNKYIQPLLSNSDENGKFVVANEAGFNIGSHLFIMYAVY